MKKKGRSISKKDLSEGMGKLQTEQEMVAMEMDDPVMSILQRFPPHAVIALAAELPDLFPEGHLQRITKNAAAPAGVDFEAPTSLLDEQIKTVAAYFRENKDLFDGLPVLPREALRQLVAIRKYATPEEIIRIEERIFAALRKRFGPFDENALVTFLVKYLL